MVERPTSRLKRVFATVSGLAVASILILLIVEIGARLLIPGPIVSAHVADLWMHHPKALWAPAYDRDTVGYRGDGAGRWFEFRVRLSAQGLRGPDLSLKRPGEFRALIAGDSYTYGFGMDEGDDMASALRRKLADHAPHDAVSVANCGATGYGPWQQRILMEERGFPLHPDVAVLQLYPANDGWNSLEKMGRRLPAYHESAVEFIDYWRYRDHWVMRAETWLRRHWYAYHIVRSRFRKNTVGIPAWLSRRLPFVPRYETPNVPPPNGRDPLLEQCLTQWYPELQLAWDEFERDVLAIAKLCADHQVPLYAYVVPFPVFDADEWRALTSGVVDEAGRPLAYEQFRDVRMAEAFLQQHDIPWIPLLDPLLAQPDPDNFFIPTDRHFNKAGGEFVSQLIVDRLIRDGRIDTSSTDGP